jgi:hypothetical protein
MGTDEHAVAFTAHLNSNALSVFLVVDQQQDPAYVGPPFERHRPVHE